MRIRRISAAALLALAAGSAMAGLTEAEALRLALARPELADLQQARLGEADADVLEAGTWPNPALELARDRTGASRETTWRIAQPIDLSGRRGLRTEAARHRLRAAEADNAAQGETRRAEVRRIFHEALRQQLAARAVAAWAARFADIGRIVDKLASLGEVAGYDRRRLARERQSAEAKLAEVRAELERARARLAALIGREPGAELDDRLSPEPPRPLPVLQARLAARPEFAALAARAKAAEADNAAAQNQLPELTLGIGGKRIDDGPLRENGNLLMLSFTLPLFDRQQARDRRSAAQAQATLAELGLARQQAEGDLLGLHRQTTQLIAAATRYRSEAVAPSAELVRIAETAYHAGESTILELLDAYRGALDAELTALDLEAKARGAGIELDQLTGQLPQ
ncbi:MAG: TolC family protein [Rhodocyclales bacterium]|nr:TolC family protein [Rhodocyclales bacterium]